MARGKWKAIRLVCGHTHYTFYSRHWPNYLCKDCGVPQKKARKLYTFRSAYTHERLREVGRASLAKRRGRRPSTPCSAQQNIVAPAT